MKTAPWLAGLLIVAAGCKTDGNSAQVREAPVEPVGGDSTEAAPLSPNTFTAMDVALVFPVRNRADIANLLALGDKPRTGDGFGTRGDGEIISRADFQKFVDLAKKMPGAIDDIPAYDKWRIVAVRPLFCARIKDAEEQGKAGDYPQSCQVEHRLVAQPLNDAGDGFKDFAIHIISRPFQPGAPQNLELAQHIASNLSQIKARAGANDSNGKGFGAYPALVAGDQRVLDMVQDHVKRFYGGAFLRTLAFMGSKATAGEETQWLFFSGPARGGLSTLIRPGRDAGFEIADQAADKGTTVSFFDANGRSLGQPNADAQVGAKQKFPTIAALFAGQADDTAVNQAAAVENIKQVILSDTDCVSCHHVTAAAAGLNLRKKVNGARGAFPLLNKQAVADGTLQSRKEMFVNLGYFTPAGGLTQLSVSQEAINDATQQAEFVNILKGKLILPNAELTDETAINVRNEELVPMGAPDFDVKL